MITPRARKDQGVAKPIAFRRAKRARALVLVAVLAAMNLGMTTVANAQTTGDDHAVQQFRQGEHAFQNQTATGTVDALELFHRGERAFQDQAGTADAQELFRRSERAFQDQTTRGTPAKVTDIEAVRAQNYVAPRQSR